LYKSAHGTRSDACVIKVENSELQKVAKTTVSRNRQPPVPIFGMVTKRKWVNDKHWHSGIFKEKK